MKAEQKAECFATAFSAKYALPQREINQYTPLPAGTGEQQNDDKVPFQKIIGEVMQDLDVESATGPDLIPTRLPKFCAGPLAKAMQMLAATILQSGIGRQR